jgi:hypothetical protein
MLGAAHLRHMADINKGRSLGVREDRQRIVLRLPEQSLRIVRPHPSSAPVETADTA